MEEERRSTATGKVVVEKVGGKSTVTRCFSNYPLKFILPRKVAPSQIDVVWIYTLSYGGGIVSGDCISCDFTIGDGCSAVLTTQSSTKVYKSVAFKCSEQVFEAKIGYDALLVVIPDPVTCFSTAKYSQKQVFKITPDSNLLIVDWITSGRHESGEKWDFDLYKSTNHIICESNPLFLDTLLFYIVPSCLDDHCHLSAPVLLEHGGITSIAERMQDYQVIAMVILLGPKLKHVQDIVQENVKNIMNQELHIPSNSFGSYKKPRTEHCFTKPNFIASCNAFGPKGVGIVIRIAATTTESVYRFLQQQLASMEPLLGLSPYQ